MALAGRLLLNLARTIPLLPCALVTFPQMTLVLLGLPPGVTVFLQTHMNRVRHAAPPTTEAHSEGISLLGLVDVGAALPQVEVDLVSGVASLQLQESCVLALVPQTTFVASEDGLTPQSDTHTAHTVRARHKLLHQIHMHLQDM